MPKKISNPLTEGLTSKIYILAYPNPVCGYELKRNFKNLNLSRVYQFLRDPKYFNLVRKEKCRGKDKVYRLSRVEPFLEEILKELMEKQCFLDEKEKTELREFLDRDFRNIIARVFPRLKLIPIIFQDEQKEPLLSFSFDDFKAHLGWYAMLSSVTDPAIKEAMKPSVKRHADIFRCPLFPMVELYRKERLNVPSILKGVEKASAYASALNKEIKKGKIKKYEFEKHLPIPLARKLLRLHPLSEKVWNTIFELTGWNLKNLPKI
jgi:hypothetical protein